ncbi:hypothetical protein RchiOBHm_Chr2g0090151 [Rosa chinensis]|uniref:Uncharacterized protein n=1 Tax=Rosa chinensis TaxID=74649 RepID=A0A2P6RJD1_ROSCH|nr:hypothetical protein RchiOBHm_Chr2g0090151 [Rosa chinensis]
MVVMVGGCTNSSHMVGVKTNFVQLCVFFFFLMKELSYFFGSQEPKTQGN